MNEELKSCRNCNGAGQNLPAGSFGQGSYVRCSNCQLTTDRHLWQTDNARESALRAELKKAEAERDELAKMLAAISWDEKYWLEQATQKVAKQGEGIK